MASEFYISQCIRSRNKNCLLQILSCFFFTGEDADEETDLRINPFALDTDSNNLELDNPKKTLRSWFDREGADLIYDVQEKSAGHFIARIT